MSTFNAEAEKLINPLITVIPLKYIKSLLVLNNILKDKKIEWALSGDFGEILRTVHVEPNCIEIVTSKEETEQIRQAVQEYAPQEIKQQTERLSRNATIAGKEFPVHIRSHFFEFNINTIKIKVFGDLQYQIANWGWGDKVKFEPDYVYVEGRKMAVMPLEVKYELYLGLGWMDRAEKIWRVLARKKRILKSNIKTQKS